MGLLRSLRLPARSNRQAQKGKAVTITTLHEGERKAISHYKCASCGGIISAGDKYHYQCNVEHGEIWTFREHIACHAVAELDEDGMPYVDATREHIATFFEWMAHP